MALNYSFSGKKVLITGGAQGIGRSLVQRFHDDGALVYTIDKNPDTIQQLRKALPNVKAEVADIVDWEVTRNVIESFGPMDHLVNNAGVLIPSKFMDVTKEVVNLHFDTNVVGVINVSQTVVKGMIETGNVGNIVNICSMASRNIMEGIGIYSTTKAALETLTKSMAVDLAPHNIRVNCISPGYVNSPMAHTDLCKEHTTSAFDLMKSRLLIKRPIEMNEIGDLIMFLLSPMSAMITAQAVVIDGGFSVTFAAQ